MRNCPRTPSEWRVSAWVIKTSVYISNRCITNFYSADIENAFRALVRMKNRRDISETIEIDSTDLDNIVLYLGDENNRHSFTMSVNELKRKPNIPVCINFVLSI